MQETSSSLSFDPFISGCCDTLSILLISTKDRVESIISNPDTKNSNPYKSTPEISLNFVE